LTLRQKDKKRLTPIEIKFFRRTGGYTLFDQEINEKILEELKAEPIDKKLRRYKPNCLQHVTRMNNSRMTKSNAELQTKWTEATWQTFEETVRRG
jgi:hypothetical protein